MTPPASTPDRSAPATRWLPYLDLAGIALPAAAGKSEHARAILTGKWLQARLNRPVPVTVAGRTGSAMLKSIKLRANQTHYYIEVRLGEQPMGDTEPLTSSPSVSSPTQGGVVDSAVPPAAPAIGATNAAGNDEVW